MKKKKFTLDDVFKEASKKKDGITFDQVKSQVAFGEGAFIKITPDIKAIDGRGVTLEVELELNSMSLYGAWGLLMRGVRDSLETEKEKHEKDPCNNPSCNAVIMMNGLMNDVDALREKYKSIIL